MRVMVKVKTRQPAFSIREGPTWIISVKAPATKNQANQELLKELRKQYQSVRIVSGITSSRKVLEIEEK